METSREAAREMEESVMIERGAGTFADARGSETLILSRDRIGAVAL